MSKAKVFSTSDGGRSVWIECPGCGYTHAFKLDVPQENGAIWKWNGDTERPTFTPSMLVNAHHESSRCHSFVTDGKIQFRLAALCLFALAQSFKFTTNVDVANSTKPLL